MDTGPRVAVVGAGPAGIFAAEALVKRHPAALVDLIDKLPTPYGLLRYGVAPDNAKVKSLAAKFAAVLAHPRVAFYGNVRFGCDLAWDDLRAGYAATVFATGAPAPRRLGVPGEDLPGSLPAADVVAWYNGYPGHTLALPDGAVGGAAVVGAGNVALDVARILARDPRDLHGTDVPAAVLERLAAMAVTDVHLVARRGPAHARFTTNELRELEDLPGVALVVDPGDLELGASDAEVAASSRQARMVLDILRGWADRPPGDLARRIRFHFGRPPVAVLGGGQVQALALAGLPAPLPVRLVVRAVGYAGVPLPGLPFDAGPARIPHEAGRISGLTHGRAYLAGWAKRGPSGVIGTNKADAAETVTLLLDDLAAAGPTAPAGPGVRDLLAARGVPFVSTADWLRIDELEAAAGSPYGRGRVKVTDPAALLACRR
jgi:ferredoxin/flavodoxin---NADP+ reductase